jgi:aminopeptidase N
MKKNYRNYLGIYLFVSILLLAACSTKKDIVVAGPEQKYDEIMLDPIEVNGNDSTTWEENVAPLLPYNPSAKRDFDLIHTKLDLRFDWAKQHVLGIAELTLKPLFYTQDSLVLDAKTMEIQSIVNMATNAPLSFKNTKSQLHIQLGKSYTRNDELKIKINYTAMPNEGEVKGSAAITSDKGLFFINPLGAEEDKPMQIWTQGETENNSKWFPCIDKPNERCTQEITLTVEDKYTTLSNGKLISSKKNSDGTRTDYYKQDKPHAPYLFMIAVGEFAVVEDKWQNIPLQYMVEKPYGPYAKQIFNHTPEMLTFFSKKFKIDFPWDKYSQIITRDYVSGAMENTGAVIFGEFIQKTDKELIDNHNDFIVAHEMCHHWFGNLVTTESWANLTLNEGFANYAEYLWAEYKYGKSTADEHRYNELNGYLSTGYDNLHPLIHYRHANKEDMFDAHSYNKGGVVLHYLRNIVGDDAFFESLHQYLKKNEYTAVEVDELRMAFEDVIGEDLNWFFDQWYLRKGHPEVEVTTKYDAISKTIKIEARQSPLDVFNTPYEVAVYDNAGKVSFHKVWIKDTLDQFSIQGIESKPAAVVFDGKNIVPGIVHQVHTDDELLAIFKYSKNYADKFSAMMNAEPGTKASKEILALGLNDEFHVFRATALSMIDENETSQYAPQISKMVTEDKHSSVRQAAILLLPSLELKNKAEILENILINEKVSSVQSAALGQLYQINEALGKKYLNVYGSDKNFEGEVAKIYAQSGNPEYNDWFMKILSKGNLYEKYETAGAYLPYLIKQSDDKINNAFSYFTKIAKNQSKNKYDRFIATATLAGLKQLIEAQSSSANKEKMVTELDKTIKEIKIAETDPELLDRYSQF